MNHTTTVRPSILVESFIILFLVTLTWFFWVENSNGGTKMVASHLYDSKTIITAIHLEPQAFDSKGRNLSLFAVPQDNSVGTNDIGNAITLISFPKDRTSYASFFRNAVDDIGGGGIYIPVIAPDVIGFGQVRRFVIYDFKRKFHRKHRIMMSIEEYIEKIAIADSDRRYFLFEIEQQNPNSNNPWDVFRSLHLFDLSGEKPKLIKEVPEPKVTTWSVVSDKNFLYDLKKKTVTVLNMYLDPSNHPLADTINGSNGNISFTRIHPHPFLPFAILSGGKEGAVCISWGERRRKHPQLLLADAKQFTFSPDGKWVAFIRNDYANDTSATYLMPVSERYPYYLGSPILLLNDTFGDNNTAWTTNPVSFVGSYLDKLYRWDLTNQAHPESDRTTFHDYIVEHDLEKLTKEKRQGLAEKPQ